jgi:hypothetical protein
MLSSPSPVLRPHPTPCPASVRLPVLCGYTHRLLLIHSSGPNEGLPSSRAHRLAIPPPIPRRIPGRLLFQVFGAVHGLRRSSSDSAPSWPLWGGLTRLQGSLDAAGWSVAPPLKGRLTLRFDAGRFPPAPAACYGAPWRLPRPDFHRLADTSLCVGYLGCTTSSLPIPVLTSLGTTNQRPPMRSGLVKSLFRDPGFGLPPRFLAFSSWPPARAIMPAGSRRSARSASEDERPCTPQEGMAQDRARGKRVQ